MGPGRRGATPADLAGSLGLPEATLPRSRPQPPVHSYRTPPRKGCCLFTGREGCLLFSYIIEAHCNRAHVDWPEGEGSVGEGFGLD